MKLAHLIAAAVAVSLPLVSASAGPVPRDTAATLKGQTESSVTLARNGHGHGSSGPRGFSAPRSFSGPRSFSAPRSFSGRRSFSGPRSFNAPRSFSGQRHFRQFNRVPDGARRHHRGDHRRGYWRNGRWYWWGVPAIGLGVYGGSCYWNCREAGYSPSYCRVNAADFCW